MLKKLEWKKLPFYGIIYDDPFTGKLGSGEWIKADGVEMRLIAEYSTVNDRKDIRAGIHFDLEKDWFVLAQNYKGFQKPRFSFEGSEIWPLPNIFIPCRCVCRPITAKAPPSGSGTSCCRCS